MPRSFRDQLAAGPTKIGAGVATFTPTSVEVYGDIGLDFAWVDLEHSGVSAYDSTAVESFVRAAETAGVDLLVRIPSGEPPLVRKVLDAGVRNVVIPRVAGPEEVRRAVRAARFSYDDAPGDRGVGYGRVNTWGGRISTDYPEKEDRSVSVGAMIEQAAAIDRLDEILDVPELGFVFLGHYDLAISMGHTDPNATPVQEAIETYVETVRDTPVPFGRNVGPDADTMGAAIEDGYDLLLIGNEVVAARQVFDDLRTAADDARQ